MVVKVNPTLLFDELWHNSIAQLKSRSFCSELWIFLKDLLQDSCTICRTQSIRQSFLQGLVRTIGVIVVDHFDGVRQTYNVHTQAFDESYDVSN